MVGSLTAPASSSGTTPVLEDEGSGGFGSLMQLAHNWADWEATKRNYELISRYVMPHFQGSNRHRDTSYTYRAVRRYGQSEAVCSTVVG